MLKLTPKREAFCQEMLRAKNQSDAYRKAFNPKPSVSKTAITGMACGLMKIPSVLARMTELRQRALARSEINAAELVRQLADIATADPNELTQYRRINCRYCNGEDHLFQWKNKGEFAKARDDWDGAREQHEERQRRAAKKSLFRKPEPSDAGGYGFRNTNDIDTECPECEGEGVEGLFMADTRKLTGSAKALYAGAKQTKNGVEIMMHSQDGARRMLGEHFGIFKTVLDANINSRNANLNVNFDVKDPVEAAKLYQKLMG